MKHTRGFTLIEMMVASVISFLIVAAGFELAAQMAHSVRHAEEQNDLGMRAAIAHSFISDLLGSAAFDWQVAHTTGGTTTTGSIGEGACAASTGMCAANGQVAAPIEICKGTTVDKAVCDAPTTSTDDALKTYLPRDDILEAVSIDDRAVTDLVAACTAANVPSPIDFLVKGVNTVDWAVDDIVLVSKSGHATFATVKAAFVAGADATVQRTLSLDTGSGTNLAVDDGSSSTGCSALLSLKGAKVFRIQQVVFKLDSSKNLVFGHRTSGAASFTFDPIVSDVDDFQVQIDAARLPSAGSPAICTSNVDDIFAGTNFAATACGGERLNGVAANGSINRVVGLRLGILFRAPVETLTKAISQTGLFDRTATTFNDKRIRRTTTIYVGLPNAATL